MTTIVVEKLEQNEAGTWEWVPHVVQLNTDDDFGIDELNLGPEICRMGKLLVKYGELAAELGAELKRKEEELKLVRAQIAGATRSQAETTNKKMTEAKVEEEVIMHPNYQAALSRLHILRANAVKADHYWRSVSKKADLLNALAFRQNAEIRKSGY